MKTKHLLMMIAFSSFTSYAIADEMTTVTKTVVAPPVVQLQQDGVNSTTTQSTTQVTTVKQVSPADAAIIANIYNRYKIEAALIGTNLVVTSEDGIVKVEGTVTAQSQADAAMQAAKSISGVREVVSNIHVLTNSGTVAPVRGTNY
ncbi:MAG: BON domain-containing protein [Gammaproteobacteria bacterium]